MTQASAPAVALASNRQGIREGEWVVTADVSGWTVPSLMALVRRRNRVRIGMQVPFRQKRSAACN